MPDREKVIKGLKCCSVGECIGRKCPYFHDVMKDVITGCDCTTELVKDALALLKEQERRINELEEKLRVLEYGDQDTLRPAT